jgi:GntR family transcriptional regulator
VASKIDLNTVRQAYDELERMGRDHAGQGARQLRNQISATNGSAQELQIDRLAKQTLARQRVSVPTALADRIKALTKQKE